MPRVRVVAATIMVSGGGINAVVEGEEAIVGRRRGCATEAEMRDRCGVCSRPCATLFEPQHHQSNLD